MSKPKVKVPDSLRDVLLEFSIAYLLEEPGDVIDFAVDFFTKLQANRAQTGIGIGITKPTTPDESIISQDEGEWFHAASYFPLAWLENVMQIECKLSGAREKWKTLFNLSPSLFLSVVIIVHHHSFASFPPRALFSHRQNLLWIVLRVDESLCLLNSTIPKRMRRKKTTKWFSLSPMNSARDYATLLRTFFCSVHSIPSR